MHFHFPEGLPQLPQLFYHTLYFLWKQVYRFAEFFAGGHATPWASVCNAVANSEVTIPPKTPKIQSQIHFESIDELPTTFDDAKNFFLLTSSTLWKEILPSAHASDSKEEGIRHLAIARFINIVGSPDVCGISQSCESIWDLHQSFEAALAMKSTNTLVKRSLDLKRYADWCTTPILPFQERFFSQFLVALSLESAPSGPLSVLQAINFCIHVLACRVAFPFASSFPSTRIKGLCYSHRASGDTVNHAQPSSVAQICHLET